MPRQLDRLDFARYPDPILRLEARPVRRYDAALAKTVALLRAAARRHGAQGLAATQCGVDAAIVLLGDEAFVNPRIVERSPEARLRCWTERCLALPPDVRVETLRDEAVTVAATTVTGVPFTTTLTGAAARQFSHEYDHARGVLIIDHAYDTVTSTAFPAMARLEEPLHAERRRRLGPGITCYVLLLCFQLHTERPVELFPLRLDARGVHRPLEGHAERCGERRTRDDELVSVGR